MTLFFKTKIQNQSENLHLKAKILMAVLGHHIYSIHGRLVSQGRWVAAKVMNTKWMLHLTLHSRKVIEVDSFCLHILQVVSGCLSFSCCIWLLDLFFCHVFACISFVRNYMKLVVLLGKLNLDLTIENSSNKTRLWVLLSRWTFL